MKSLLIASAGAGFLAAWIPAAGASAASFRSIAADPASGSIQLEAEGAPGNIAVLEFSSDLASWIPIHASTNAAWSFVEDGIDPRTDQRFYRIAIHEPLVLTPAPQWKNRIRLLDDAFWDHTNIWTTPNPLSDLERINWVKFTVFRSDPTQVIFQNTREHPLHYAFATTLLDPFLGIGPAVYDAATLHASGQVAVIGSLLFDPDTLEYGFEFAGEDPYPREMIRFLAEAVDAAIEKPAGARRFYMPTFTQTEAARADAAWFAARGLPLGTVQQWLEGENIYSHGWGIGRLRWLAGAEIEGAFRDGRLKHDDILLTDQVPAELPVLAGIVCLSPSTPNSHAAILARSYGVPFLHATDPALIQTLQAALNHDILLRVIEPIGIDDLRPRVKAIDVEGIDPALKTEIRSLKYVPALAIQPRARCGAYSLPVDPLTPADIRHVGGKAANSGFLRRTIPDHSPSPAIAFTFDLWDDYLQQTLPTGQTLAAEISARISRYAYPADRTALAIDLAEIRRWITDVADFSPAQRAAILEALAVFAPGQPIRFRSSTNVEDTELFVGAGLYDSFSGCLLDDLDDNDAGPCRCDPAESKERGVFRAIRKVFASFYNDYAVIERLRHRVDESAVGMAVLVHHSFPDEIELANGVATAVCSRAGDSRRLETTMVTQKGAVPVANPSGDAIPEVAEIISEGQPPQVTSGPRIVQNSNLLSPGETQVLANETQYRTFQALFVQLADAYHSYYPAKSEFTLDFEYKRIAPDWLVIKQIRALPRPPALPADPVLLNEPVLLQVSQGPRASVFAHHRLKSLWSIETASRWLNEAGLASSFFTRTDWQHTLEGPLSATAGRVASWDSAWHETALDDRQRPCSRDHWSINTAMGWIDFCLEVVLPRATQIDSCPVFCLSDLEVSLRADYSLPQMIFDSWKQEVAHTARDSVRLEPVPPADPALPSFQTASFTAYNALHFTIDYVYKPQEWPGGMTGFTPTLWRFGSTTMSGILTGSTLLLQSYWSQTCQTFHKPYWGDFLFEPGLEPDLPAAARLELEQRNTRLIYLRPERPWEADQVHVIGFDGTFRNWP